MPVALFSLAEWSVSYNHVSYTIRGDYWEKEGERREENSDTAVRTHPFGASGLHPYFGTRVVKI